MPQTLADLDTREELFTALDYRWNVPLHLVPPQQRMRTQLPDEHRAYPETQE